MLRFLTGSFGNPSSIHSFGREAKKGLEEAREKVAALIGAAPQEILFTSGGTEADNLAILGAARQRRDRGKHIITSAIEHHAVLDACAHLEQEEGFRVTVLPVDGQGLVDPAGLRQAMEPDTVLVSVMLANNEIGTIEPVAELAAIARERGVLFHTDAVQAVGQIPVDVTALGVDLLSLSAHKIYGPKGAGVLYVRRGTRLQPLFHGGSQERRLRPGTEGVAALVGLGEAAALARGAMAERAAHARGLREHLWQGLRARLPDLVLNGHPERRLPNNLNVSVAGVQGESVLLNLDLKGVAASSGSACAAGSTEPSHVLKALGVTPEVAQGALRLTLGEANAEEDVDYVLEVFPAIVEKLRRLGAAPLRGAGGGG